MTLPLENSISDRPILIHGRRRVVLLILVQGNESKICISILNPLDSLHHRRRISNAETSENFIATVSHELRTPMNAILGFNDLLLDRVQDKPEALKVLNLSELVIALRPEVQPGDELPIKIARDGKEADQGVGYLDDGTMVVVEGARGRIGERLPVVVTGALQNPTGRIVFARTGASPTPAESTPSAVPGPTTAKRKAKPKAAPPKPEAGSPS